MTVKHATASTFVFCDFPGVWRMGVITHPRLGWAMAPGGHVEANETPAEAAMREVSEEMGLASVRLIQPPSPRLPENFPYKRVEPPWWITEMPVPSDDHLAEPHVHVDHQYLAVAAEANPAVTPAHPFSWYCAADLQELEMPEDTRQLAMMFEVIEDLACARPGAASGVLHHLM